MFIYHFIFFISDQTKKSSALEFIPGIIVRFGVNDPIDDEKKIKQRIRAAVMENVNYVDAKIGANEYFVRCAHSDQAKTLSNAKILGNAEILSGMLIYCKKYKINHVNIVFRIILVFSYLKNRFLPDG